MNLSEKLNSMVLDNQLEKAITLAEDELKSMPQTDFHKIIGKNLLHLTEPLIHYIDEFYQAIKEEIDVKAIFSEMNGFTINYELWFIDLFVYDTCGGIDDLDWLAAFSNSADESMMISGLEDLQTVFQDYMENERYNDDQLEMACEICEYLIILKLQELFKAVKNSAVDKNLNWSDIPIFVTAHDYEMIYEAKP